MACIPSPSVDLEPSEKIRASQQLKGTVFITNQGFAEKCGSKPGFYKLSFGQIHRRRIKTEEWAKVVAAAWGTELIKFLAVLPILHHADLKNRMNSSYP